MLQILRRRRARQTTSRSWARRTRVATTTTTTKRTPTTATELTTTANRTKKTILDWRNWLLYRRVHLKSGQQCQPCRKIGPYVLIVFTNCWRNLMDFYSVEYIFEQQWLCFCSCPFHEWTFGSSSSFICISLSLFPNPAPNEECDLCLVVWVKPLLHIQPPH